MFQDLFGKQPLIISLDIDAHVEQKVDELVRAGISSIELLDYSPHVLAHIRNKYPRLKIGFGNIIHMNQLETAYRLGVDFISSPGFLPSLVHTAQIYKMNYLPGIASISEGMKCIELGIDAARVCPGDLKLCNLLNKYCAPLKLFPNDVQWEEIEQFLDLPSVAAVGLANPDNLQIELIAESLQI
jgi:2-dehydro-3-deoxyphosphogluconate aldolase/(4S)-4-hydroxy-2-oxoglutarate aldolase